MSSTKVEFSDRLPSAVFQLAAHAISVESVREMADSLRREFDAETERQIAALPQTVALQRLRERVKSADGASLRAARAVESAEAGLERAVLDDCASEAELFRLRLADSLRDRDVLWHEKEVLNRAANTAARDHAEAVSALQAKRNAEFADQIKAELSSAVETLRGILETPEVHAAIALYAAASEAGSRLSSGHFPPTRAPWSTPARAAEVAVG